MLILEPLAAEPNKKVILTNTTFLIVDFDTQPENLTIYVDQLPKKGKN